MRPSRRLEYALLENRAGGRRDAAARADAASESDRGRMLVFDEAFHVAARQKRRGEQMFGEARLAEHRLDGERATRDVAGVLQHGAVAGHQCRAAKRKTCQKGKFQGIIASTTPSGLNVTKAFGPPTSTGSRAR